MVARTSRTERSGTANALTMTMLRKPLTRLLLGIALLLFVAPAAAASAHAVLDNSVPASGATLTESPPQIVLDFDERVETAVGFIKLFDSSGTRIALPGISRDAADSSIVRVNVPTLDNDTYVAAYRVVSADGHPVDGAITFQVGEGNRADVSGVIADALSESATDGTVSGAMRAVRLVGYLALAVVLAGLFFLLGGAVTSGEAKTARIVGLAAAILSVCAAALTALQGAAIAGNGLSSALSWSGIRDVLDTRTGHALAVRCIVAAVVAIAYLVAPRARAARVVAVFGTILLPLSFGFGGHPGAASPALPTIAMSLVHVAAVSVWLGGLVLLVVVPELRIASTVKWFSQRAAVIIVIVAATGLAQGLLIVEDLGSITDITYGKTLIAKVVLVGAMLLAAAVVRRRFLDSGVERLRGVLVVEAAVGLLVLAVTSGLVVETPRAVSSLAPFSTALVQGETIVNVSITPARVGSVEMHIIVTTPGGSLDAVKSARARLSLASRDVPPIAIDPTSVGPNHFVATTAIPYGGEWKLDVILVDASDREILFTTTAPIRN
mgnify:CR=1 FL=1